MKREERETDGRFKLEEEERISFEAILPPDGLTRSAFPRTDRPSELLVGGGMPDADCRCTRAGRGRWGVEDRRLRRSSSSSELNLQGKLGLESWRIRPQSASTHPPRSPSHCALRTSDLIYEAAFSGEDNGEEAAGRSPARAGEGRKEGVKAVNYAIRSTHWTGKWRQPRSGRLLLLLLALWPRYVCK